MDEGYKKPVIAICYDFDKTLSPDDMQAQGYIQSVGYEVESFWKESNGLAEENDMDQNLAYMFTMIQKAHGLEHLILSFKVGVRREEVGVYPMIYPYRRARRLGLSLIHI